MLYSIFAGVAGYYAILFFVGVLVNSIAIEGSLIALAAVCFIGGYYARRSRFVSHLANTVGGVATGLLLASWFLLPILRGTGNVWVTIIAVLIGVAAYIGSRRVVHRRWLRRDRDSGQRPAPPFGREWCRWVIAFLL